MNEILTASAPLLCWALGVFAGMSLLNERLFPLALLFAACATYLVVIA